MKWHAIAVAFVAVVFVAPPLVRAAVFSSSNFIIQDPAVTSGGGLGTSTNFQLWGSFAQPAAGLSTSTNNQLGGGFLYFGGAVTASQESASPTSPSDPGGGGPIGAGTAIIPPIGLLPQKPLSLTTLIDILTGEEPITIPGCAKQSDFNCDGAVNLQDLSILLTVPNIASTKALSFLFADWTEGLPVPALGGQGLPASPQIAQPAAPPLAQISSVVGADGFSGVPEEREKGLSIGGFFRSVVRVVWQAIVSIILFIARLLGF